MQHVMQFLNHLSNELQCNLPAKKLYIRGFLLDYLLATANEHILLRFDKLLFVYPIPFAFPTMAVLNKYFYSLASIAI